MTLKGYTTEVVPNKVFSAEEMLDWLASPKNNSNFTYAMGWLMIHGYRGDDAFSATTLTSTCPREFRLKQQTDYLLQLEKGMYAIDGTFYHAMVETTPPPADQEVFRERRFGKKIDYAPGKSVILAGRMDEVVLNYKDGLALIRDYKRTKAVPKGNTPWPTHQKQLNIYRWLLSDYPYPPCVLPEGKEFWENDASDLWKEAAPIEVGFVEIAYRSMEDVKRVTMPVDKLESVQSVHNWLLETVPHYLDSDLPIVPYLSAIDPAGKWKVGWKCDNYCPVKDQCQKLFKEQEQPFDKMRAVSELVASGYRVYAPDSKVQITADLLEDW